MDKEEALVEIASYGSGTIWEHSLVLNSQDIPHYIVPKDGLYVLMTEIDWQKTARETLAAYRDENSRWRQPQATWDLNWTVHALGLLALPTLFFVLQSYPGLNSTLLTNLGRVDSERILSGEWWRLLTALTLHADSHHYLSNMVSGYFLLNLLTQRTPWALGLLFVWLAGIMGNFLTAWTAFGRHLSIGFSTAVFASLGILATLQIAENLRWKNLRRGRWSPLLAAIFLVVLLGFGENADFAAHIFGFLSGLALGIPLHYLSKPSKWTRIWPIVLLYGTVLVAWWKAGIEWTFE